MPREKFTKIPVETFKNLVVNAGVLLSKFDVTTGSYNNADMMGATSGGINFKATPSYKDWGADVDNCPKNTKELMRPDGWDVKLSGAFTAVNRFLARSLMAFADVSGNKITPRDTIDIAKDFNDVWLVADYSDKNVGTGAGLIAIHLIDAISTGGFQLQTADKDKGKLSFEYTAHYSIDAQDTVPFEVYIEQGTDAPGIALNKNRATVIGGEGGTPVTLTAFTTPAGETVTWASNDEDVATVDDGVVTGVDVGYAVITASITVNGETYTDICTVEVPYLAIEMDTPAIGG